jgi:Outer membrane protein beta-barrel domain
MSTNAFGQSINMGVKAGLNIATVGGRDAGGQSVTSFNAGIFGTFNVAGLLALQPELLYSIKGYKMSYAELAKIGPVPVGAGDVTSKISYLEIPVLIKLNTSSFRIIKPNIFAGPEIAFKLNGTMTAGLSSQGQNITNVTSTDFGIIVGAGADINLPMATLIVDIRYDYGMRVLYSYSNPPDLKNRVLSLNAGIEL